MNKQEKAKREFEGQASQFLRNIVNGSLGDEAIEMKDDIVSDYANRMLFSLPSQNEVTRILAYEAALNVAKVLESEIGEEAAELAKQFVQNSRIEWVDVSRPREKPQDEEEN